MTAIDERPAIRRRAPSLEGLFVATLSLLGLRLGLRPIADNSMLVHLRTGLGIAGGHGIPRVDPYTFTAHGHPWVVQSWLAEATYGWLWRLGGDGFGPRLIVLEQGLLMGLAALLVATLARTGRASRSALAAVVALAVSAPYWTPRPLLFGLVAFGLTVLVVERRRSPWLLVPIVWVWVNTHGSFPLGLLWIGAVVVGEWFDGGRRRPVPSMRYMTSFVVGLVVACVNPLGPRLLVFPLTVLGKRSAFRHVAEWRPLGLQGGLAIFTAAALVVAVLLVVRSRPGWRELLPALGFVAMGVIAIRNLPLAGVALAPVLGRGLAGRGVPSLESVRAGLHARIAAVLAVMAVLFSVAALARPGLSLSSYPVSTVTWMQQNGYLDASHRVASSDVVGCYLVLRYGEKARNFVDDRVDMLPLDVSADYVTLFNGRPSSEGVLDRRGVDIVLWDRHAPLVRLLSASGEWSTVHSDGDWLVLVRR
jgi:hypothetical protein